MNTVSEELDHLLNEEVRENYVITPGFRTALTEASSDARVKLRKAARIGAFTISKDSEKILSSLIEELERPGQSDTYFDHIDRSAALISQSLKNLKKAARRDLDV